MSVEKALSAVEAFMGRVFVSTESEAYDVFLELNLSFSQSRLIFVLGISDEPMPITEIAGRIQLSVAAAGRNVDQLVKLGLASRSEDPTDRRVKLVALTERGREAAWAHHEAKREALRVLLDELGPQRCAAIAEALEPFTHCQLSSHPLHPPTGETTTDQKDTHV